MVVVEAAETVTVTVSGRGCPIGEEILIEVGGCCSVDRVSVERRLGPLGKERLLLDR